MAEPVADYDPRYLAGVLFFNEHDFFEAHEVWEDLWGETFGTERRFIQGLIQAAVGLLHFGNGNVRGAVKLFHSSRDYMARVESPYRGLEIAAFWRQMESCFAQVLANSETAPRATLNEEQVPCIVLDPAPLAWPDLAEYREEEHDE
jgi:predicted metal-dependent hydrolase